MTMGERIKAAREAKNLYQGELAEAIGVKSAGVISNWEKDINKPDAEKIVRLCIALDISASYLLDYYGRSAEDITPAEASLIASYRRLDEYDRGRVAGQVETLLGQEKYKKTGLSEEREIS